MKQALCSLLLIFFLLPLSGCGYSQSDVLEARMAGYEEGYAAGYETGYDAGKDAGYTSGKNDAERVTAAVDSSRSSVAARVAIPSTNSSGGYIGNTNSHKFHLPTCTSLPNPENRIYFDTRTAAIDAGYDPCGRCNP